MAKYWMVFLGFYILGGVSLVAIDYVYDRIKRHRRAEAVARRLSLLQEFAKGKRVA